jgi:hypothetical protein
MRVNVAIRLLTGLGLVSAPLLASPAMANSWHHPNVFEESNGGYMNYSYDDGICHYTYWYSEWEKHAQASRYGDCSHLVVGPDGRVMSTVETGE